LVQGKLTRKEIIQQDIIRRTLTAISAWLLKNRVYIIGVFAAFVLLIGITYLVQQYLGSRTAEMQAEFSDALAVFHAPVDSDQPNSPQENSQDFPTKYRYATETERYETALSRFQELAEKFKGSRVGNFAHYYVGLSQLELEREADAKTTFESITSDSVDVDIRNLARNSLAQIAMGSSDFESAIQLYQQILDQPSRNLPEQIVRIRLGDALEGTGQLEQALEQFRKVTTDYAGTSVASEAQDRIRRIEPRIQSPAPTEENSEAVGGETGTEG
jgi:TolA-binding protein